MFQTEKDEMAREAMNKLTQMVRDSEMEVEALKMRNDDLVSLVQKTDQSQQQKGEDNEVVTFRAEVDKLNKEKEEIYAALTQKHQESLNYYAEIERLNTVMQDQQSVVPIQNAGVTEKVVNDNSNEIIVLKTKIKDLERRLNIQDKVSSSSSPSRRRAYSESLGDSCREEGNDKKATSSGNEAEFERQVAECEAKMEEKDSLIREAEAELLDVHKRLQEKAEEMTRSCEEARAHKRKLESLVSQTKCTYRSI
jgi:chromosome segregation ATPase